MRITLAQLDPIVGEFRAGEARSGEVPGLGPETIGERAVAFVRQLGSSDRWFVIGAASEGVRITTPETGATVSAGPLTVEGLGRGFESTINVLAVLSDPDATMLDEEIAVGGAFGDLEPFSATLDLSDAQPGDTVILVARGDAGLGNDPGEFTAIGVTVG